MTRQLQRGDSPLGVRARKTSTIVDARDVRNWMLKSRDGANLNALEFRKLSY